MQLPTIIAVASGGAIGATARMLINGFVNSRMPHALPFGTLTVNLIGSLFIGILFAYFHLNEHFSLHLKTFLVTGILGALTTYSTFAMESFLLLESGHYGHAFLNMALNLFGTIVMAGLGYMLLLQLTK
ncbi:MAG: fluoride efflux transporter CrcB [Sulfurovum sp.]|nr:fluoride efflux transporter CrcB [Sulfurovum sp.]MCB4744280.1 fluoride efflux transporter CrcB [Sulfurovum sp.]MCB4745832.1 fluoride efflux transporter CrcB [Sulfurovum sp.]MCB4747360.1 fluoride efflux transporter CrcB [Sulfurovum sp.]MCB4748670.1 fluoride efflux transporter CrcB [Sulfurovum sp.]